MAFHAPEGKRIKRELGTFERALVIADQYAPFHFVYVLRLESPPPPQFLGRALKSIQSHHPFLRARLLQENGKYYFTSLVDPILPLRVLPRWNDDHWIKATEVELGTRIEHGADPLFRCTYLYDVNQKHAEIILTFFHSIVDDASAGSLMNELLKACASFMEEGTVSVYEHPSAPPQETRFPSAFRGVRLTLQTLRYGVQLITDEILYRVQTRDKRTPPLHKKPSHGHILSLTLPGIFIEKLNHRAQLEKVTLDAVLNAALMIAVNRRLYAGKNIPMRTFSFWDIRPYVDPPLKNEDLACYVSMLRHTVLVEGGINPWQLAHSLQWKFYHSLRSGDHFVAATLTESLLKMVTAMRSFRMGATAVNFNGESPLKENYGEIILNEIHGYTSAYALGPEFSGQVRFFNGQLILDFVYLDVDMSNDEARAILEEVKSILNSAVTSPLFVI